MTTYPTILVSLDSNEAARPRADKIREAVGKDEHIELSGNSGELPFDLRFEYFIECENLNKSINCEPCDLGPCITHSTLHIEIKDFSEDGNSDYLSSIMSGHLWEQCLAARELGEPFVIVVLGDDNDVGAAIRKAASRNHRMDPQKLMQYFEMVEGFEANCLGMGIQVWRLKTDPYQRMLLRARKILVGGNLSGFAPKPSDGERQAVGLSILAGRGIGAAKARAILDKFHLVLIGRDAPGLGIMSPRRYTLTDCDGIGPKLAKRIRKNIEVVD